MAAGSRPYRTKARFPWSGKRYGVPFYEGHVLKPGPGQLVLCRSVEMKWEAGQMPLFTGHVAVRKSVVPFLASLSLMSAASGLQATAGVGVEDDIVALDEPQGADLCFAAGLGASPLPTPLGARARLETRGRAAATRSAEGEASVATGWVVRGAERPAGKRG
jgi:hypothetical protein